MGITLYGPGHAVPDIDRDVGGVVGHVDDGVVGGSTTSQDLPASCWLLGMSRGTGEGAEQRNGKGGKYYEQTSVGNGHKSSSRVYEWYRELIDFRCKRLASRW